MFREFKIGDTVVGEKYPPYFIADIGANHDGSLERAFKLIELAKAAGANAAKFQNFHASKIVSKIGFENLRGKLSHQSTWKKSVYEIYEDASISLDWTARLKEKCDDTGIEYFTSPYDIESVDFVNAYVNLYKIGSGDITWLEIIKHIGDKGKPVLLATGASTIEDVDRAMNVLAKFTNNICLMQCNTNYTLDSNKYKFVNLNVLNTFRSRYPGVVLGLSDHTIGNAMVLGAVALGARVFEKHFTDSNELEGPDHKFAMNPVSWKKMVEGALEVFYALGDGIKRVEENEIDSKIVQRRALRATNDLAAGKEINANDLEALRPIPEDGIEPYNAYELIGKKLTKAVNKGEHLTSLHFILKK
ncbi:MAG: N-acetylneuraminate synthase family protein [Ginsengibacter sp.]